jgi:hypothetical protein
VKLFVHYIFSAITRHCAEFFSFLRGFKEVRNLILENFVLIRDVRDAEGNGTTATARNIDANGVLDSEANTARKADLSLQPPLGNPEKIPGNHANTGALPTASARPDANGHLEKSAPSGKVDMELFQWPKFIISLSRKEKEDDFFAIKGCKLPIRPKKRLKHVEKTLHVSNSCLDFVVCCGFSWVCFPLWCDIWH